MRIVISNPDSLGDVLLREPMFAALHEAGHELLLVVRDFVEPLARDIAPYAQIAVCVDNPYAPNFQLRSVRGRDLAEQVVRFSADLFVIASYQYTELEQQLAALLPSIQILGFKGHLAQADLHVIHPSTIQYATQIEVPIETPEPAKNELLCSAILATPVSLRRPVLKPTETGSTLAASRLRKLGLNGSPFWAVCAGDRPPWGSVKNWGREKWIELCHTLIDRHSIRILFIGTPEEHDDTKAIQSGLGIAGRHTVSITGESITIQELVGLLEAAQGYIGKDTGPMHFAAALGKPVVAVFGGGHWPRFVPQARTGAVFSVDMPCQGCGWVCRMERPHCVKDIPIAPVLQSAEMLVLGQEPPFSVNLIPNNGLLEAKESPLQAAERQFGEFAGQLRAAAGEQAGDGDWRDDWRAVERDREKRLRLIEELSGRLEATELDSAQRLRLIEKLSGKLSESELDRGKRLRLIEKLSGRLEATELDSAQRLHLIEKLSGKLEATELDSGNRLAVIEHLSSELATTEADRTKRGEQIVTLRTQLAEVQDELNRVRNLLPYRILKQLRIV